VGYLPDYEDDIFISYAHNDNESLPGQRGWIDVFHQALEMIRHGEIEDAKTICALLMYERFTRNS